MSDSPNLLSTLGTFMPYRPIPVQIIVGTLETASALAKLVITIHGYFIEMQSVVENLIF